METENQLQEQFEEIQSRLDSPDTVVRGNAAFHLARFGTAPAPAAKDGDTRDETHYPYFVPAASRIAAALILEPHPAIRQGMLEAVRRMVAFSREGEGQPLLYAVIERLVDANRTAKGNLIRALAYYRVYVEQPEEVALDQTERPNFYLDCLMAEGEVKDRDGKVITESSYHAHYHAFQEAKLKQSEDDLAKAADAANLGRLSAWQQASDCSYALAEALKALSQPAGLPVDSSGQVDLIRLEGWRRSPALDLSGCMLFGAFTGYAIMRELHLQGADLSGAQLAGTHFSRAQLQGANFHKAHLAPTMFYRADLRGANLREADMQGARLGFAKLQGADFTGANMDKAHLYGAHVCLRPGPGEKQTIFPNNLYQVARFKPEPGDPSDWKREADPRTQELVEWLKSREKFE